MKRVDVTYRPVVKGIPGSPKSYKLWVDLNGYTLYLREDGLDGKWLWYKGEYDCQLDFPVVVQHPDWFIHNPQKDNISNLLGKLPETVIVTIDVDDEVKPIPMPVSKPSRRKRFCWWF